MSILTVDDFKLLFDPDRIEQLATDGSLQHGTIVYNESVVAMVVAQAEGVVKNTLSLQYGTAELEADAGIKRITADLAMYYLELRRPPVSVAMVRIHNLALQLLTQLQRGEAKLAEATQLLPTGPTEEPTEAISTGFFNLTEAEQNSLT